MNNDQICVFSAQGLNTTPFDAPRQSRGHLSNRNFLINRKYRENLRSDLKIIDTTAFGRAISTQIYPVATFPEPIFLLIFKCPEA